MSHLCLSNSGYPYLPMAMKSVRFYKDPGAHGFFPTLEQAIRHIILYKSQPVETLGPKDVYLTL